ncbi:hypothetical protein CC85DRAFT_288672 [Cutaneotrichosporon oleaginosum]|uniref:Uncharacterized protein n=1 Tax=Cutaneotrichosporon oleaginosum TaxID=879819 RepID=A0A0J0XE22_9TREE|nr:uncharacterized protein CC85DRAFT_288672 [Cutaneotrichosporon oleaginosum]KLT39346.1 hypothetical protein CC85DRAFT_288672 [Cutaneotrichosporon oleaginosum]TXT08542.1 hypothetical protein COLE_05466 [Cutaneotrichosporon oleaginosum]
MSGPPSSRQTHKVSPPVSAAAEQHQHSNGASSSSTPAGPPTLAAYHRPYIPGEPTTITETIASAPNPHNADFSPLPFTQDETMDPLALDAAAEEEPGSPTARLLRAIAPPNATQPNPNWPAPPPNASVNLFIGRALLSNGNDNWPLKPNDIVNWIRKHYPEEWDGDEGRCSAHRVRTYLARKGADMYYEKLNQGCIAGWRIRQNHLWRFENGGFQGRGMKQEEAILNAQKENEMAATAAHKAAAAAALAQGHPGIKVSMSSSNSGEGPPAKRQRKMNGQARRKNLKKGDEFDYGSYAFQPPTSAPSMSANDIPLAGPSHTQPVDQSLQAAAAAAVAAAAAGETDNTPIGSASETPAEAQGEEHVEVNMVQQAMAAANSAQMDELEMGMQLPIEMQMHSTTHDDERYDYGQGYYAGQGQVYGGQ